MRILVGVIVATLMTAPFPAPSQMLTIVGYVEEAVILPEGLPMRTKMDTGAEVGSINASDVEFYNRDGDEWVRFTVDNFDQQMVLDRRVERYVIVRRAGTDDTRRPMVRLGICIAGRYRQTEVGLVDRSGLDVPLMVGRTFMSAVGLVVNSAGEYLSRPVCAGSPTSGR